MRGRSPVHGLGPRARRRLARLGASAGALVVVAGLIYWLAVAGNSSAQHRTPHPGPKSLQERLGSGELNLGVAYGTSPNQLRRRLGAPAETQANCWIYRGSKDIPGSYRAIYIDAVKFCFSAGPTGTKAVMETFNHSPAHTIVRTDPVTHTKSRTHFQAQWFPAVTLMNPALETPQ